MRSNGVVKLGNNNLPVSFDCWKGNFFQSPTTNNKIFRVLYVFTIFAHYY